MKRRISRPVGLSATRRADSDTTDRGRGAQTTRMGDMAAMAARYETLQEDEVIVPSSKGHTDASAAARAIGIDERLARARRQTRRRRRTLKEAGALR